MEQLFGVMQDFPSGSDGKASAYQAGDLGSIPGSGRSPGEGNGNPLQYSCQENPMDGGAWWITVLGIAKSRKRLSHFNMFKIIILIWVYKRAFLLYLRYISIPHQYCQSSSKNSVNGIKIILRSTLLSVLQTIYMFNTSLTLQLPIQLRISNSPIVDQ